MEEQNKMILSKNSEKDCSAVLTVKDCINSSKPKLSDIIKTNGTSYCEDLVCYMILDCAEQFNVGKNITNEQAKFTARLIVEECQYFTADDFKLCFNNAIKGYYGKSYDRIDAQVIFEWINRYKEERMEAVAAGNQQMHDNLKKLDAAQRTVTNKDQYIEALKKLSAEILEIGKIPKTTKERKRTEQEELVQRWITHFDFLYGKFPAKEVGNKIINRYGKKLNIEEYLNEKLKQQERIKKYKP